MITALSSPNQLFFRCRCCNRSCFLSLSRSRCSNKRTRRLCTAGYSDRSTVVQRLAQAESGGNCAINHHTSGATPTKDKWKAATRDVTKKALVPRRQRSCAALAPRRKRSRVRHKRQAAQTAPPAAKVDRAATHRAFQDNVAQNAATPCSACKRYGSNSSQSLQAGGTRSRQRLQNTGQKSSIQASSMSPSARVAVVVAAAAAVAGTRAFCLASPPQAHW